MGHEALVFVIVTLSLVSLAIGLATIIQWGTWQQVGQDNLDLQWLEVGPWRFRYHRSGQGPNLVLLHGLGANLYCWRALIPLLARRYTVVALDLPGFGQSSALMGNLYGLDEQAQRLHQFLHQLGINQSYLVGNSLGGNIALWFALNYPTEVLGLSVIAPATSPKLIPVPPKNWLWLARPAAMASNRLFMELAHRRTVSKKYLVDSLRVEETFKTYGRNQAAVRAFLLACDAIRDSRLGERLKEIKNPLQILWGAKDKLVPRSVIVALESSVGAHENHSHPTGGHHLQEDEPEWVAEKIDTFIASLHPQSTT